MNYEIPEVAEFTEEIEKLETSTPGHAKFFNAIYEKIFHNTLFLRAKTAVLESEIAKSIAIALGRNQALVFNTYDDMAAWFSDAANAENVAGLANGTNLYIIAKDVPDYWWSSMHQKYYELETQKVDLTKYDNIIGNTDISDIGDGTLTGGVKALNNNLDEVSSNIENLGGFTPVIDSAGKITGYKTEAGADTVFPFNSLLNLTIESKYVTTTTSTQYAYFSKTPIFAVMGIPTDSGFTNGYAYSINGFSGGNGTNLDMRIVNGGISYRRTISGSNSMTIYALIP